MSPVGRDDLGFKIKIISKLLTQNMNNSITSLDLTSSQARVLGYLCYRTQRQEKVYPRDIERHFRFTHPTVSGLLQRLEAKGLSKQRTIHGGQAVQADPRHKAGAGSQPAGPRSAGCIGAAAGQRYVPRGNHPAPKLPGSDDSKSQRFQRRAAVGGPVPTVR